VWDLATAGVHGLVSPPVSRDFLDLIFVHVNRTNEFEIFRAEHSQEFPLKMQHFTSCMLRRGSGPPSMGWRVYVAKGINCYS
jgi:hypothetical protein